MAKFLVIRLSALGDVAMSVPVIHSFAAQYPQHEVVMLSRAPLEPAFQLLPGNVSFFRADLGNEYKGLSGLNRLFNRLKEMNVDYVVDLHDVLRTQYLRFRFRMSGVPVGTIRKGRIEKKKLVRRHRKVLKNLKSSFERYADVFERLGFPLSINFSSIYEQSQGGDFSRVQPLTGEKGDAKWVGIAPFAKHKGKIYPLGLQEQVVAYFSKLPHVKVFLFGGGAAEQKTLDDWAVKYPTVTSVAGKLKMDGELIVMSRLDVMLSMDSANMHLASLVNVPVVSVWGATHPYAGFSGWKQLPENAIQTDLACRPCSVFGNKLCFRKDYACFYGIKPEEIIKKIEKIIS